MIFLSSNLEKAFTFCSTKREPKSVKRFRNGSLLIECTNNFMHRFNQGQCRLTLNSRNLIHERVLLEQGISNVLLKMKYVKIFLSIKACHQ